MQEMPRLLSLSTRFYRVLLYAYPVPFRRRFEREMVQLFRDDARNTLRRRGPLALVGLWVLTFFDLLQTALAEHIWEVFHMPLEKLRRWSGLAAAIGSPLFVSTFASHAFWGVVDRIGLAGNDYIHPLLAGIGLLLMGIGLYGLYRCLPRTAANAASLGVALFGILLGLVGLAGFFLPLPDFLIGAALILPLFGLAGMGLVALSTRALGGLSFAPLAIVATGVAFALLAIVFSTWPNFNTATQLFLVLYHLSWLLLGVAIWAAPEDAPGPLLPV